MCPDCNAEVDINDGDVGQGSGSQAAGSSGQPGPSRGAPKASGPGDRTDPSTPLTAAEKEIMATMDDVEGQLPSLESDTHAAHDQVGRSSMTEVIKQFEGCHRRLVVLEYTHPKPKAR